MRLAESLQDAGITQWRRMAKYYGLEHLEFAGNRLYQGLYNSLRDADKITEIINRLPQSEQRLLKAITLTQSIDRPFDYRHWRGYTNYYFDFKLEVLVNLQNRGLIYLNRKQQYYIPSEIHNNVLNTIQKESFVKLKIVEEDYLFSGGEILLKDILRFLDTVNRHKIRITNNNNFYKTDLQKLSDLLQVDLKEKPFNIGTKIDFIYKYIINQELAIINKSELQLTSKGKRWHLENPDILWQDLLSYWVLKYPQDSATRVANTVLLSIINVLPNSVITVDSLYKFFLDNGGINPTSLNQSDWFKNTVNELSYFGILHSNIGLSTVKANQNIQKETIRWFSEKSFITQANLEILVSLHASLNIHWQLASFCEDQGGKEMYSYRVTKDSVYNALLRGLKLTEIEKFLQTYSVTEVPHNLKQVLKDWENRFGKVYVLDCMLLCCKDKNIAKQLLYMPELNTYVQGLVNENTIVIAKDNYSKLIERLEKAGYMPYRDIFTNQNKPFSTLIEED